MPGKFFVISRSCIDSLSCAIEMARKNKVHTIPYGVSNLASFHAPLRRLRDIANAYKESKKGEHDHPPIKVGSLAEMMTAGEGCKPCIASRRLRNLLSTLEPDPQLGDEPGAEVYWMDQEGVDPYYARRIKD